MCPFVAPRTNVLDDLPKENPDCCGGILGPSIALLSYREGVDEEKIISVEGNVNEVELWLSFSQTKGG